MGKGEGENPVINLLAEVGDSTTSVLQLRQIRKIWLGKRMGFPAIPERKAFGKCLGRGVKGIWKHVTG